MTDLDCDLGYKWELIKEDRNGSEEIKFITPLDYVINSWNSKLNEAFHQLLG